MSFTLDEIIPWGRSLSEYIKMFNLSPDDLQLKIIGCADGPASFNSEMTERNFSVTSCDPIYQFTKDQLSKRFEEVYPIVMKQVKDNIDDFLWDHYGTPDRLGEARKNAMNTFLHDYDKGLEEKRYILSSLPELPFKDSDFDLALCSHFLFTYSDMLTYNFHLKAIEELIRLAEDVRIFPLLNINGEASPYLEDIVEELKELPVTVTIEEVEYHFQKGGNKMLRIVRN